MLDQGDIAWGPRLYNYLRLRGYSEVFFTESRDIYKSTAQRGLDSNSEENQKPRVVQCLTSLSTPHSKTKAKLKGNGNKG